MKYLQTRKYSRWPFRQFSTEVKKSYLKAPTKTPLIQRTVGQQAELIARKCPDRIAVTSYHQNETVTFAEALHRADKVAAGLANLGVARGDKVGLWMPNYTNWYITALGIYRLGAVCVKLNPAFQGPEIGYCIEKVGIKAIVTSEIYKTQNYHGILTELYPDLREQRVAQGEGCLKQIIVDSDKNFRGTLSLNELIQYASEREVSDVQKGQNNISPHEGCDILFTSGTTGTPKAAVLSHFASINSAMQVGKRLEFDRMHHKVCLNLPMFHCLGSTVGLMAGLVYGSSMYLANAGFKAADSAATIKKYDCTYVCGSPTMLLDIVSHVQKTNLKLDSLRYALTGGAVITPRLINDLRTYLGVGHVRSSYGQTECSTVFQSMPDEDPNRTLDYIGKLHEEMEVKVVDDNGDMVPFGTPGELLVRSYGTMIGYYGDKKKTEETKSSDGWVKTGDEVILYEDGYGKINGRKKDMIIRGGENIYPKEIETFLMTHPSINEVYVAGVPDQRLGEAVAAFVKLRPGVVSLTLKEIQTFCKGKIAHFKVPKHVKVIDEFPKTLSGKVKKFELVEAFAV